MIKTILVDDNPNFITQAIRYLSNCDDLVVVDTTANGNEAVSAVLEQKPDLVLMDIRMSGVNGLEATQQIKDLSPDTEIIILTGYDLKEYRDAALSRGATDYVLKKNMGNDLCEAIKRAMNSS